MFNVSDEYKKANLASYWDFKFKEAMVHKAPTTKRWNDYIDAYKGDYFKNVSLPEYKSNMVSNYIFSIVETIRPIMLDNNPRFQSMPRQPEGLNFSDDLNESLFYEWDREDMMEKLCKELINTLVIGNAVFFIPWNSDEKEINGTPVSAFNIFPDPLATSVKDAEYIIYADYYTDELLRRKFPEYADKLQGGHINYGELVNNNDKNARIDNKILIIEVYTKDYENEVIEKKDYKKYKPKYPNGRQLLISPELGLVLEDKHMPYNDGEHPFEIIKDYDVPGQFWGEGEVAQLLSPQKHMNELNNAVIDHAKTTANSPWVIDKNSGIGQGKITSRQGLIIRKNPGSDVSRIQPPNMPSYVVNAIETFKNDMNMISGIHNTLRGDSETGVYTAQGILALQEAGQVRIRLKVKLLEAGLSRIARKWFSRMKQFWKEDRWVGISKHDGTYDMKRFTTQMINYDYDIKITAGSTMPSNRSAMLDLMIRLAQTQMPDGNPIVDREAVATYLPEEVKSALLRRSKEGNIQVEQIAKALEQLSQQVQQQMQQNEANDKQTMSVVEQLVGAVEKINGEIMTLKEEHIKKVGEEKKQEEIEKVKKDSYNTGYVDAEKLYKDEKGGKITGDEKTIQEDGLPDDMLQGLEDLTDEELDVILEENPELVELINNQ